VSSGQDERQELHRLRRRIRQLEGNLDASEREVALLRNSRSFKITAPLRWLWRNLDRRRIPAATAIDTRDAVLHGLPVSVCAGAAPHSDPNASHRTLALDQALRPLVRAPVSDGRMDIGLAPGDMRYHGKNVSPLRIGSLATAELREELSFDAEVVPLQADGWAEQISLHRPDFVLIEGAWELEGGWGVAFAETNDCRARLQALLAYCRSCSLPVVLWAREDVANLERLRWLAGQVDRVYAIDVAGQAWFDRTMGRRGCGLLVPAVQPALYNPVRSYALRESAASLRDKVVFDGWWELAGPLSGNPVLLAIEDRLRVVESRNDYSRVRLEDSGRYAPRTLGVVSALEKSALLRCTAGELLLPGSFGQDWRQTQTALRAVACGGDALWGGTSAGIPSGAEEWISQRLAPGTAGVQIDALLRHPLARMRSRHKAFRRVMDEHSVAHRVAEIASDLGLARQDALPRVAHLLVTMRPELLGACIQRFRADLYPAREMVVVLHGDTIDLAAAGRLIRPGEPIRLLSARGERSLGDCLNLAIAHTDAPYWMKLDDDDHYGPAYTCDMMRYQRALDPPLMGKPPMFLHLEQGDELRWDPIWADHANLLHDAAEADAALVAGGTLAGKREVAEVIRFSSGRRGGSDSDFIRRAHEHGFSLLAADGFNFARFRSKQEGFHTWRVSSNTLADRTKLLGVGSAALKADVFI